MTASQIARVVEDVRLGRVLQVSEEAPNWRKAVKSSGLSDLPEIPIIDATGIYNSLVNQGRPISLYDDHRCISPPWLVFFICFVNFHGNVIVMLCVNDVHDEWETAEPIDWSQVKWRLDTSIFVGGTSKTANPSIELEGTYGPVHSWQYAIGENGEPLDLHWTQLMPGADIAVWDMAQLVNLGALNFLNCRNVEIVEPKRDRAEQRRIARTGQRVYTINVFPTSKQSAAQRAEHGGTPLTSVRGHFAHYGPEHDRGLLFGKYSGRYWIPQFARGSKEYGEVEHDYKLVPE